jgi:uncharacterized protein YaiE (UPF0345 family)
MKKIIAVMVVATLCFGTSEVKALILNDGGVHTIDGTIDDWVRVEDSPGGAFTTLNLVEGGEIVNWLDVFDYSQVNMSGGSIGFELFTNDYSHATISGGSIAYDLNAFNDSEILVIGGSIGDSLNIQNNARITISGSDFAIDGVPVDYGIYTALDYPSGTLTGTLTSRELINSDFEIYDDASIFLVPEPATLLLVCVGSLWFRRRNRM